MTDFLTHLGALSLGGAAAVLLLWGTSFLTRSRYAARWRCWAWLLLCLRLAVPLPLPSLSPEQPMAPIQLPAPSNPVIYAPSPAPVLPAASASTPEQPSASPSQPDGSVPAVQPVPQPIREPITLSQVLFWLWLAGAAAILLWNLVGHLRFVRYLHRWSAPVEDKETLEIFWRLGKQLHLRRLPRLFRCRGLTVPMLAGLLRPVLLLPQEELPSGQLRYSLLHELTHYRRRDIPFKALGLWVAALHWFNPAVWLMARCIERDTELSCDDAALRLLPSEEHPAYGQTILAAVERLKGDNR